MLVCRRWAHIGMYTKSLWSFIDIDGHEFPKMQLQLQRSGLAPLSIKITILDKEEFYVKYVIKDHAERIQDINISGRRQSVESFLANLSQSRLPTLRSIKVERYTVEVGEGLLRFPDLILDGRAPFLHSLSLNACSIRWDLLHDLTHLSIVHYSRISDSSVTIPSLDILLSALERSPSLQTLKLQGFIASEPGSHLMVSLPQLEHLELMDNVESCANLLQSIIMSPTASLSLYPLGISHAFVARDLLIPVRRHLRSASARALRLLNISCTKEYINIGAYTDTKPVDYFDDKPHFCINSHPFAELDRRKIITKVLHAIPIDAITHLETRFHPLLTETSWKTVFFLLPSLHTLIIGVQEATVNVANAIIQMIATPRRGVPFPRLQTIHLYGVFIDFRRAAVPGRVSAALIELLTQYKDAGMPVGHLEVTKNDGLLGDLRLRKIFDLVGKVTLDGNAMTRWKSQG